MSAIQASLQKVFVECLESMLGPIVRLTLYCGLGHSEFAAALRRVFIEVASQEFGVRGRPANIAKVSAKTGLPRKAIHRHRAQIGGKEWTPDDEISPLNTVIHYWRFDERFCSRPGQPRDLQFEGSNSFTTLVRSWVGDIPVSTIRQELIREGIALQNEQGDLSLVQDYSFPESLDADFLRNAAFNLKHHAETLFHNANLIDAGKGSASYLIKSGRFERIAWTRRLNQQAMEQLRLWVRSEGAQFIHEADEYMTQLEDVVSDGSSPENLVGGVGLYFFQED